MTLPERMTITPDPVTVGDAVTICYDTRDCTFPITIELRFPPATTAAATYTIAEDDLPEGTTTICFPGFTVPAGSWNALAEDTTGQAQDAAVTVKP